MFTREITNILKDCGSSFPVTVVTGPRQSGKTTILRYCFPNYKYISLEDPDVLERMKAAPRGILESYLDQHIIIDEAQRYNPSQKLDFKV